MGEWLFEFQMSEHSQDPLVMSIAILGQAYCALLTKNLKHIPHSCRILPPYTPTNLGLDRCSVHSFKTQTSQQPIYWWDLQNYFILWKSGNFFAVWFWVGPSNCMNVHAYSTCVCACLLHVHVVCVCVCVLTMCACIACACVCTCACVCVWMYVFECVCVCVHVCVDNSKALCWAFCLVKKLSPSPKIIVFYLHRPPNDITSYGF